MADRIEGAKLWIVIQGVGVLIFALLLYTGAASVFVGLLMNDVGDAHALTPGPSRSPLSHLDIKLSTYWASFAILAGVICVCAALWSAAQMHRFLPAGRARGIIFGLLSAVLFATTVMAILSPGGTMAVPQALTCGRAPFLAGSGFLCGWNLEPGWNKLLNPDGWVGAMLRLRLLSNILFQVAVICVLVAIVVAVSVSRWEQLSSAEGRRALDDRAVARLFVAGGLVFSLRVMSQIIFGMWPIAVAANDQLSGIMVAYSVFFGVLGSSVLVCILAFSRSALFERRAGEMGDRDGARMRAWSPGRVALFLTRESTIKTLSTLAPLLIAAIGGPLLGKG
jgi:hypothetical protein